MEQRIALSTEPEPALMPIFPALASSVGLCTVCSSWNLVHGSSLLLLHLVRVGMLTSDSQCHDTAAMAGRRSRGRRREQVFFSLCRKATCLENYLCRPKVQKSNLFCEIIFLQAKSATCGGLITDVIGALVLLLTAPLFLFGGFVMVFFYHVETLDIASPWFSLLPKIFFGSGFNNLFCAAAVTSFRLVPASLVKRALFLLLVLLFFTSCLLSGISTYGCFELQSIILQV